VVTRPDGATPDFDVVVVGAGPAGSSAALAAARAGARTLLLERATFPRYKTCGGGLIGASLASLPEGFLPPVKQEIFAATFTLRGGRERTRRDERPLLALTDRAEFDQALADAAAAAGAEVRFGVTVTAVQDGEPGGQDGRMDGRADGRADAVRLTTSAGDLRAGTVIAADGSASRLARHVGVRLDTVDLGLENEVEAGRADVERWAGRIHLDWGAEPGSYAWVFPKGETLTVGVIMTRGRPDEIRRYLADFSRATGLDGAPVIRASGHLTRCRTPDSPLGRGRILVCGDAAGLLEPWTREGISFALRSGRMAGAAAATHRDSPGDTLAAYESAVRTTLVPEMAAGRSLLTAFERHPGAVHAALTRLPLGWREFAQLTRGDTDFAAALRHPAARAAVHTLNRI
jgi:geranylgeranyl reductase family protein